MPLQKAAEAVPSTAVAATALTSPAWISWLEGINVYLAVGLTSLGIILTVMKIVEVARRRWERPPDLDALADLVITKLHTEHELKDDEQRREDEAERSSLPDPRSSG